MRSWVLVLTNSGGTFLVLTSVRNQAAVHLCAVDPKLRILIRRIGVSCVPTREASTKELSNRGAFLALVKGVVFQMIR